MHLSGNPATRGLYKQSNLEHTGGPFAVGGNSTSSPKEEHLGIPTEDGTFLLDSQMTLPNDLAPGEKRPAFLMITGSGPIDKDVTIPAQATVDGTTQKPFKEISDALASEGFITLRYNKRGIGSANAEGHVTLLPQVWSESTAERQISDAKQALEILARDPRVSKVCILGHSEGTMIAGALAASGSPVAAMALLGVTATDFKTTGEIQTRPLLEKFFEEDDKNGDGRLDSRELGLDAGMGDLSLDKDAYIDLKNSEAYEQMMKPEPTEQTWGAFVEPAGWRQTWMQRPGNLDLLVASKDKLQNTPVLLMTGEDDTDTPPAHHAIPLQEALSEHEIPSQLKLYPGLGHLLCPTRDGRATYGSIDPAPLSDLREWASELRKELS